MRKVSLLISGALLGALLASCAQPAPKCSIARGSFAASYQLIEGSGPCAELHGELLGIDAYSAQRSPNDETPNYDRVSIAIQPQTLTDLLTTAPEDVEADPSNAPYALGYFASSAPAADLCTVPVLSAARVRLPARPMDTGVCTAEPARPAVDVSYQWSNVQVYVTPTAYGTQLSADLTYVEGTCSARYRVWAVYPAVSCNAAEDGHAEPPPDAGSLDAATPDARADEAGTWDASMLEGGLRESGVPEAAPRDATAPDAARDAGRGNVGARDARVPDAALSDGGAADASMPSGDSGLEEPSAEGGCGEEPEPELGPEPIADETLCSPVADPTHGRASGSGIHADFAVRCDPNLLLCVPRKQPPSLR